MAGHPKQRTKTASTKKSKAAKSKAAKSKPAKSKAAKSKPANSKAAKAKAAKSKAAKAKAGGGSWQSNQWKDVAIELAGTTYPVILFDWASLAARDGNWLDDFDEYIVGDHDEPVEHETWTPIGVVGLGRASRIESFAELTNRGFLAIVNEAGDHPAGSIIWVDGRRFGGAITAVAASAAKLVFKRV